MTIFTRLAFTRLGWRLNRRLNWRLSSTLIALLILSACSSTTPKDDDLVSFEPPTTATPIPLEQPVKITVEQPDSTLDPEALQTAAQAEQQAQEQAQPKSTDITDKAIPNPYLAQAKDVNRASQAQFKQALKAFKAKQYAKARRLFIALSQAQPELSGPYLNLALIALKQKQSSKAESYFKKAIEANQQNIYAYSEYAYWLRQQGRFDEAAQQLEQALKVWPDYPAGHRNLGILLDLYQGQGEQALLHYKKYQSLLPKPDRLVRAWIIDLERRLKAQAAQSSKAPSNNQKEES